MRAFIVNGFRFPKPYADLASRLRVPVGFLLAAAFVYLAGPDGRSMAAGLPVVAAGMLLRVWAAGHLAKNQQLATGGPFAYTRNPLYLGTLIVAAGFTIAARSWFIACLVVASFVLIYLPVIQNEQSHLEKIFPGYRDYARRVPVLWPRFTSERSDARFSWALFMRNEEYQASLAFLVVVLFLAWKAGLLLGLGAA